ncbi:MAG: histidine kinase [Pseudomonadales bacterium]|nr:histidine kinase [Pseudomonadales bacterium]
MLRLSALSLAAAGAMAVAPTVANAEVAASVSVANMYLWRGVDLGAYDKIVYNADDDVLEESGGGGVGAISGDLTYSDSGFYTGIWGSSGDSNAGTEYDLFAGYGAEFSGVSMDLSVWTYVYPSSPDGSLDNPGELSEVILSVGFAGFALTGYDNIAGGSGYGYYTLSYGYDAFSVLVGKHDVPDTRDEDMVHIDLSYAYNDNLSFTLSQQIEEEIDNKKAKFVVAYSLPIEM